MYKKRKKAQRRTIPEISYIPELPITAKKDEIIESIKTNSVVIIAGETGSGKTTQIPKFCIAAGRGTKGKIGCTQPRRIAAINVAARIAEELRDANSCGINAVKDLGEVGQGEVEKCRENQQFVGYKIRFDDTSDPNTIIKVMTDGILLAETQRDPFLREYDTIIVDEAHERSLNIDFTLGILRNLTRKRNDLKVIITSATIDTEKFSKAFNNAPIIEVSGRMYPVEIRYLPPQELDETQDDSEQDEQNYVEAAVEAVEAINRESRQGDVLIFMPTEQDITETIELLRGRNWVGVTVLPLYARLSAAEQAKIFHRGVGRKIIVSTNVAETSLTIPGIKYVIDTGFARIPHYSPRTRTTALPVTKISKSSADQRKGRCGRIENGICVRLYDEESYNSRAMFTSPEILRSNLAEVILRMISLNLGDVSSFPFIDMPSPKSIKDGFDTLIELGAISLEKQYINYGLCDGVSNNNQISKNEINKNEISKNDGIKNISYIKELNKEECGVKNNQNKEANKQTNNGKKSAKGYLLTEKGRIMARIPVDPKLSRILIEANERGCLEEAAIIASALSISDPRQRPQDKAQQADQKHAIFKDPASDFITLLNIWNSCYGETSSLNTPRNRINELPKKNNETQNALKSRNSVRKFCKDNYLSFRRMREWSDIHSQIVSVLKEHGIIGIKIGGEFYSALHKSILAGYLSNIAHKKEKNLYHTAKGQKAMIFPGSSIFNKAGNWIVASEYVETSQLFARTAATIDVDWLEELGKSLCTYSWSSPHWEKKRGEVVAKEQVSLFGLVIVAERTVAYGRINPVEAGEIFIRSALVEGDVDMKFPFMLHNQKLIEDIQKLEEKTRKRDILITDEDIYLFYRNRLDRDFFNIKTFAKYLKDKNSEIRKEEADNSTNSKNKTNNKTTTTTTKMGNSFLFMTLEDLRQKQVDEEHLSRFPDTIKIGDLGFHLEYDFKPGSETDGITIKVPAISAGHLLSYNYSLTSNFDLSVGNEQYNKISPSIDWLVPGLFREKVMALIKHLPKSYRVKLLPASEKADIIANEIQYNGKPLFYELSRFVKERFNADIPPSAWSDEGVEPHLKMRISIRDEEDNEMVASRDFESLQEYLKSGKSELSELSRGYSGYEKAKKEWEIENITSWDFLESLDLQAINKSIATLQPLNSINSKSLPDSIKLETGDKKNRLSFELYPALTVINRNNGLQNNIALRLFSSAQAAMKSHKEGVRNLFCICYENDINALKKDIKNAARLRAYSSFFGGNDRLTQAILNCITKHLFSCDIRTKEDFESHAAVTLPTLYEKGQELISRVTEICEEHKLAINVLMSISMKNMNREAIITLMKNLKQNLEELIPPNFLEIYPYKRIADLKRYIAAIRIRAERAEVDPSRDQKRWAEVVKYVEKLDAICRNKELNEQLITLGVLIAERASSYWSKEKADAVDTLFWMIEEYKVSLFAQELKTPIKVSAGRLDAVCEEIEKLI